MIRDAETGFPSVVDDRGFVEQLEADGNIVAHHKIGATTDIECRRDRSAGLHSDATADERMNGISGIEIIMTGDVGDEEIFLHLSSKFVGIEKPIVAQSDVQAEVICKSVFEESFKPGAGGLHAASGEGHVQTFEVRNFIIAKSHETEGFLALHGCGSTGSCRILRDSGERTRH